MTRDKHRPGLDKAFHDLMSADPAWRSVGRWAAPGTDKHFELFEPVTPRTRPERSEAEPHEGDDEVP